MLNPPPKSHRCKRSRTQQGVFLIEALLAILILSVGVLAMVGLQGMAVSAESDAQYRIEAANAINQLVGRMWAGVDRTSQTTLNASVASFAHYSTTTGSCTFDGAASTNAIVTDWIAALKLPSAASEKVQVAVDTASHDKVTVTICWKPPNASQYHQHAVVTYIN